jgi:uncharacterized membrane protein
VNERWATGRTETFSDGVFAIAVTLLVLDLHVPVSGRSHLWHAIWHQWPAYVGYTTSFLTIAAIWLAHHGIFRRLRYVNATLMRLNLLLLLTVAFLPFPTQLMAQAVRNTDAVRAAVIFYGSVLLSISLLLGAMWAATGRRPELLQADVTKEEVEDLVQGTRPSIALYLVGGAIALVQPQVAVFGFLLIAVVAVLRARGDETSHDRLSRGRSRDRNVPVTR